VDKSMTSLLLARAGLPTPDTFVVSRRAAAAEIVAREAGPDAPLVLKPLFGSQGEGLRLVRRPEDLPSEEEVSRVYYLQRFVGGSRGAGADGIWRDYRVFVCAGRALAGMIREGETWITNVHRGGRPRPWALPDRAADLAVAAAAAVTAEYCGVDLIDDGAGGFTVLEVNSMPAWSGLQTVTETGIARAVAAGFLAAVRAAR
jgi:ribosomal protein S6--L-glutamate ligase